MDFITKMFAPVNAWLSGKKRVLGSIAATATGVGAIAAALADGLQQGDLVVIGGAVSAILMAWGFTHASQKVEALLAKKLS